MINNHYQTLDGFLMQETEISEGGYVGFAYFLKKEHYKNARNSIPMGTSIDFEDDLKTLCDQEGFYIPFNVVWNMSSSQGQFTKQEAYYRRRIGLAIMDERERLELMEKTTEEIDRKVMEMTE